MFAKIGGPDISCLFSTTPAPGPPVPLVPTDKGKCSQSSNKKKKQFKGITASNEEAGAARWGGK